MALWATESNAKGMFSTSSLFSGLPEHDETFVFFYQGTSVTPVRPHSHIPMLGAPLAVLLVQQDCQTPHRAWSSSDPPQRQDLCECTGWHCCSSCCQC